MTIDQWIEETAKQLEAEVESFRPSVLSAEVVEAREDKLLDDKEKITIDFLAIREQRDKAERERDDLLFLLRYQWETSNPDEDSMPDWLVVSRSIKDATEGRGSTLDEVIADLRAEKSKSERSEL